jgi:hypothetical protein
MNKPKLDSPILLIGGTGRSGTTIFRKIVELHPDVATIPEWRLLTDPEGIIEYLLLIEQGNPFMLDQAFRRLEKLFDDLQHSSFISRLISRFNKIDKISTRRITNRYYGIDADKMYPGFKQAANILFEELADFHWYGQYAGMKFGQSKSVAGIVGDLERAEKIFSSFLNRIALIAMEQSGKSRFLEKNTWSLLHFDRVSRLYPRGKMVHIHRDPRDVVASYMKQPWMPSDPCQSAIILKRLMDMWWSAKEKVSSDLWLEIDLNDLVVNTEQVLKKVCEFWEIDFAHEMMQIDLSCSNAGRWKKDLNLEQQHQVSIILRDVIDNYNYDSE